MTDYEPFFKDRETRLQALGEKSRARLASAMEVSEDPESTADQFFSSVWLAQRTGKTHAEIMDNWEAERASFWGEGSTDGQAYDSIRDHYAENNVPRGTQSDLVDAGKSVFGGGVETALDFSAGAWSQVAVLSEAAKVPLSEDQKKRSIEIKDKMKKLGNLPSFIGGSYQDPSQQVLDWSLMTSEEQNEFIALNDELKALGTVRRRNVNAKVANSIFMDFANQARKDKKAFQEWNAIDEDFRQSTVGKVAHGLGQLGFYIPASMTGPIGLAAIESTLYEEAYNDAKSHGATELEAFEAGMQFAIPAMFLEKVGLDKITGFLFKGAKAGAKLTKQQIIKRAAERGAVASVSEGATEALQGQLLDFIASNSFDEGRELMTEEVLKKRFEEFFIGAVVGGTASTGFSVANDAIGNAQTKKLVTAKVGGPLTKEEFKQAREHMTDEQVRNRIQDPETSDLFIEAINGDRNAQVGYNAVISPNPELPELKKIDTVGHVTMYQDGKNFVMVQRPSADTVRVNVVDGATPEGKEFLERFSRIRQSAELQELSGVDTFERFESEQLLETISDMRTVPTTFEQDGEWKIVDPDGELLNVAGSRDEAIEMMNKHVFDPGNAEEAGMVAEAISYFNQVLDGSRTFEQLSNVSMTLGQAVQAGQTSHRAAVHAVDSIRPVDPDAPESVSDLSRQAIFGHNKPIPNPEGTKIIQDISFIYQGGDPLTVIEETTEGYVKRSMSDGSLSIEELMDWKSRWEEFTGQQPYADNLRGAIEMFSDLAIDYALTDGAKVRDATDSEFMKELLPTWFETFIRKLKVYYHAVTKRAVQLVDMKERGELPANLEEHLRNSLGLNEALNEQNARQFQIEIETAGIPNQGTSILDTVKGRLPHPELVETEGGQMAAELRELYEELVETSNVRQRARKGDPTSPVTGSFRRRNVSRANAFFSKEADTDLDRIREGLEADGFTFETVDEMLEAVRAAFRGDDTLSTFHQAHFDADYTRDPNLTPEQKMAIFKARLDFMEKHGSGSDTVKFSRSFTMDVSGLGGDFTPSSNVEELKTKMKKLFGEEGVDELLDDSAAGLELDTFQLAFHGSGVKFDKFDTKQIGTGEGAQAFGWGLYFAEEKSVAEFYKQIVGGEDTFTYKGVEFESGKIGDTVEEQNAQAGLELFNNYLRSGATLEYALFMGQRTTANNAANREMGSTSREFWTRLNEQFEAFDIRDFKIKKAEATGFKVELAPKPEEYLDWDNLIDEQSSLVNEIVNETPELQYLMDELFEQASLEGVNPSGQDFYRFLTREVGSQKEASMMLKNLGIRGIRFKDRGSRGNAGGTSNFVIFDDSDISILDTFQLGPLPPPPPDNAGIETADEAFERYHELKMSRDAEEQRKEEKEAQEEGRIPLTRKRNTLEYIGLSISSDLRRVSPGTFAKIREHSFKVNTQFQEFQERTIGFRRAFKKLTKAQKAELGLALSNGEQDFITDLIPETDMLELRMVLDELREIALEAGFTVSYRKNYFPRSITDLEGLLASFGKKEHGIIRRAIREAEKNKGILSDEERIHVINLAIRGFGKTSLGAGTPSNFKEREIETLTPEQYEKYFANPFDALDRYMQSVVDSVAQREFFGQKVQFEEVILGQEKTPGFEEETPFGKIVRIDLDASIGAVISQELKEGRLQEPAEQEALLNALTSYFGAQATPKWWARFRAAGYVTSLGTGVSSTLTQLQDTSFAAFEGGIGRATTSQLAAWFGISDVKVTRDLGLGTINTDYKDMLSTSKTLDTVFTATGLKHFGRAGQNSLINSGIRAFASEAKSGRFSRRRQERLNEYFANDQARIAQLRNALAKGEITDDVRLLGWNILADYHPVDLTEMPRGYLDHPRLRVAYMLKTFTIKMLDTYRREIIQEGTLAIHQKDWRRFAGAFKNLVKLLGMLWLTGVGVTFLKDFVFDRDPQFSDIAVDNLHMLYGWSRYNQYYAKQYGYRQALLVAMNPPMPFFDYPFRDISNILDEDKTFNLEDAETWRVIPLLGQEYYWWFGGGDTKIDEEREKRRKKQLQGK